MVEKAKQWLENLGVGKPYEVDVRLENFVAALCWENLQKTEKAKKIYREIIEYTQNQLDKWDCAYPGVEVLPDGTFVITTYGHWTKGEPRYIMSVRLKLAELDEMTKNS